MFHAPESPHLVPFDGSFRVSETPTKPPPEHFAKKRNQKRLKLLNKALRAAQRILYAHDRHAVLLVFQAMDAAGKDSTIRAVLSGVNPAGCQVFSFKKPSAEELDHDFLWRTARALPERGRIGVFNRSYYEEVLVVRVHPKILVHQRLPDTVDFTRVWDERLESIREHERHLARNGTVVLKFWLNVSKDEQRRRFLARLDEPEKNWKFATGDVRERRLWAEYMDAYEEALNATSLPWAPWYAIPADDKPYMRAAVADIIVRALESLDLRYPQMDRDTQGQVDALRRELAGEERDPANPAPARG